jgi:DNA-binding transcriptional LysR family regulator
MFGRVHLAPVVLDFLARTPGVGARTFYVDRIVNLVEEGFDVALRIAHLPDSGLAATPVGRLRRVVVASPAYLAAHGEPHTPADLSRHHGVGFTFDGAAGQRWVFRAPRGQEGLREAAQPQVRLLVNQSDVAVAAACAGHGLARALSYQVAPEVRAGRLRVVLEEHEPDPIPVHLVHAAGRRVAAKVRAFVAFAAERLRAEPVLGPDQASARIFA